MGQLKIGDIVARKSYGQDILFKVVDIKKSGDDVIATLKGISYRIEADAPESDLIIQNDQQVRADYMRTSAPVKRKSREVLVAAHHGAHSKKAGHRNTSKETPRKFSLPGNVLHNEGNNDYLEIV